MTGTFRASAIVAGASLCLVPIVLFATPERHGGPPQQTAVKRVPITAINSLAGKDLFKAYCEQCHGPGGKGDGPAAANLRKPPTDLTQLAGRNNGKYNQRGVEAFISGDRPGGGLQADKETASPVIIYTDGARDDMPVYGILFRYLWQDQPSSIRCGILARYVGTIQAK